MHEHMELDYDMPSNLYVVATIDGTTPTPKRSKTGLQRPRLFFFRPVDGNMAHHTLMGEQLKNFDFVIQRYELLDSAWKDGYPNWPSTVTLKATGTPMTCRLSHLDYSILSQHILVWTSPDSDYRVVSSMCPGLLADENNQQCQCLSRSHLFHFTNFTTYSNTIQYTDTDTDFMIIDKYIIISLQSQSTLIIHTNIQLNVQYAYYLLLID